jgi:K+-transporting ATPase ATPase C chain
MLAHLRANLILLVLTVAVCCVLYPLALWGIGQTVFHDKAEGSLIDADGKPALLPNTAAGSRLIAQPFGGDEYFQPRPSAASYNAAASGASNWGASNPLLRDRVARTIGPIAEYREGSTQRRARESRNESPLVAPEVVAWFKSKPDIVREWAKTYSSSAQAWVNADDKHKAAVTDWAKQHPEVVEAWKKENSGEPKPADLAGPFFDAHAAAFHATWPKLIDDATWTVPAVFFDMWLQAHPAEAAELQAVPGDMVTASGSGLDPHITMKNARFQLDRVASAWAGKNGRSKEQVRGEIQQILSEHSEAPLGGLVGVPLVNVLEVNVALSKKFAKETQRAQR